MAKFTEYDCRLHDELDKLDSCIKKINYQFEELKEQYRRLNLLDIMNNPTPTPKSVDLEQANRMRFIYECFSRGLNSWETAEECKDMFGSVWDAYNFIASYRNREQESIRYARGYLVKKLALNGFKNVEIAKITGYSPQRCGQIARTFKENEFFDYSKPKNFKINSHIEA